MCKDEIHKDLKEMEISVCPFCDQRLQVGTKKESNICCDKISIISDEREILVCRSCGSVHEFRLAKEFFIDFHECKFKIKRKSIYHRKYHMGHSILEHQKW